MVLKGVKIIILEKSSVIEDNLGGYRSADNMGLITELIFKDHIS